MSTYAMVHPQPAAITTRSVSAAAVVALAGREALRLVTSKVWLGLLGYVVLVFGVDSIQGTGIWSRAALAELIVYILVLYLGPFTFVASHLVATSARRGGAARSLSAVPLDRRRRDLALCLGVLIGMVPVAVGLAGVASWAASGPARQAATELTTPTFALIDIAQVGAIVLGAGVLGVVVARWLPFAGSLLIGFVAMVAVVVIMTSTESIGADLPWFAPYVAIENVTSGPWIAFGSRGWHLGYLVALSVLGTCVAAVRHPGEGRRPWVVAALLAACAVVATGVLQLS